MGVRGGVLRLRAGAALGLFLLEGTSVVAALGAVDAPLRRPVGARPGPLLAIVLVASSLHAFPDPPLPLTPRSHGPADPRPARQPPPRRRPALHCSWRVGLAVAAGAMALAIAPDQHRRRRPGAVASRPDVVERLIPPNGARELRQSELGIDLAPGYEGTLVVNGIEIPDDQLRHVPAQNQVFFTPGEGKAIEELDGGPGLRGGGRLEVVGGPGRRGPAVPVVLRRD